MTDETTNLIRFEFKGETWIEPRHCFGREARWIARANRRVITDTAKTVNSVSVQDLDALEVMLVSDKLGKRHAAMAAKAAKVFNALPDAVLITSPAEISIIVRASWEDGACLAETLNHREVLDADIAEQELMAVEDSMWRSLLSPDFIEAVKLHDDYGDYDSFLGPYMSFLFGKDELKDVYRQARTLSSVKPEAVNGVIRVDMKAIAPTAIVVLKAKLRAQEAEVASNAVKAYHDGQGMLFTGSDCLPDPEGIGKKAVERWRLEIMEDVTFLGF